VGTSCYSFLSLSSFDDQSAEGYTSGTGFWGFTQRGYAFIARGCGGGGGGCAGFCEFWEELGFNCWVVL